MPQVGGKKFAYTEKGESKAVKLAEKLGKPVKMTKVSKAPKMMTDGGYMPKRGGLGKDSKSDNKKVS